jgi:hypothetical protein
MNIFINMKIKIPLFLYKSGLTLLLLLLIFGSIDIYAQKKNEKKSLKLGIDMDIGFGTTYDDNVLKYSEKYLTRFMNGEDEGRFHIKTYDDLILIPSISARKTFKIFGKKSTIVDAGFKYRSYLNNDINNWSFSTIGVRQNFAGRASFKLYYSYIPRFYVRHFRDAEWVNVYGYTPITFTPYEFSKDNYGVWVQNTFFKSSRVMFTFNYATYYHNKHYTEYDSKNYLYRIKLFQRLNRTFRLELAYQFTHSDAKGYDQPHETKAISDNSDATYDEDSFAAGLIWNLPRLKKRSQNVKAEFLVINKYYTTKKFLEEDRLHAGRVDNNLRIFFTYSYNLSKSFDLSAFYNWYYRNSGSSSPLNDEYISDEKDYLQNQFGIEITYSFKI